jgi:hypothetical protein
MLNKQQTAVIAATVNSLTSLCFNAHANSVECALVDGLEINGEELDYSGYNLNTAVEALAGGVLNRGAFLALVNLNGWTAVDTLNMLKTALVHIAYMSPSQLGL